ncbi:MAG: bifunctional glutamate N-acetyltransferase/amino-acid acetyltransferase ArgJ [Planctomycetes bacterium]|nr:bifunctional glutamate N-acetyltransferase/amino-acid acetyltransferase ArgJ [Planctomycetota bacterium]
MVQTTPSPIQVVLPQGFRASAVHCGLRKQQDHADLGLLIAGEAQKAVAVFTQNRLCGAHVHVCREHLQQSAGLVRAILVNARNANCATGQQGIADARAVCAQLAQRIGCPPEQVLMCSTGPIGAPLPKEKILAKLDWLVEHLSEHAGGEFARAIMTTDTFPKAQTRTFAANDRTARVTGFAKGAGMIHPNMATMLAFTLVDACPEGDLQMLLRRSADRSYHRVTIDGDTSPNDTLVLWAGGATCATAPFEQAVTEAGQELARSIARDGEGATRFLTIEVRGAMDEAEANLVGRTIATSPLVKTAVAGRDPNWGRILSAAGRCGVPFDAELVRVWVGPAEVYRHGVPHPEREGEAHQHLMQNTDIVLGIDLQRGIAQADIWSCDLTKDYIQINADYRS